MSLQLGSNPLFTGSPLSHTFEEMDFVPLDFSTHYKRFLTNLSLFLHFDFCSTHYKTVLKLNSFSLSKKKEAPE